MKKLFCFILLLFFTGCGWHTERERATEDVIPTQVVYTPSQHEVRTYTTCYNGHIQMHTVPNTIPEKWNTVFTCRHGGFVVNSKSVYNFCATRVGQTVKCFYDEVYWVKRDKQKQVLKKKLYDLNFIGLSHGSLWVLKENEHF